MDAHRRHFLFLQGPHGPFFAGLARALARSGARTSRVAFNRPDQVFWRRAGPVHRFTDMAAGWPEEAARLMARDGITDIVLYGDTRPIHLAAASEARAQGITVHVFEEGYLRPWWITYERDGANGNSPIIGLSLDEMRAFLARPAPDPVEAPAHWGTLRQHAFWGALYHGLILSGGPRLPSHRQPSVAREAALNLARLALGPATALSRRWATWRLNTAAAPYHLVLLQLDHDANYRAYGAFPDTPRFIKAVVDGFAAGAPAHHELVFKAHPLEDSRIPLRRIIADAARRPGVLGRTRFIAGGKLGPLLDRASTAITVNSTAAQQALFRGLPVRALGRSVYTRPEFVSTQPLARFFAHPSPPDRAAYAVFRQFLLETSQVPGSFYAARGRSQLYRRLPDMMLSNADRYAHLEAAGPQHLSLIAGHGP